MAVVYLTIPIYKNPTESKFYTVNQYLTQTALSPTLLPLLNY